MKIIRRSYFVNVDSDIAADALAGVLMVDKSEVVDLALFKGLEELETSTVEDVMRELTERRLLRVGEGSIKSVRAKRRAK